jgi:hypothetical protein
VHPELDQDRALGGEGGLEVDDLLVRPLPRLLGGEPLDPLDQHPAVPGAVQHGHATPAGQHRPEPPQEVVPLLVVGGGGELGDPHVPGVQLADEALDRPALPGGVPALEQHAQRRTELPPADLSAEQQAQVDQSLLGLLELLLGLLLRQADREVDVVEPAHGQSLPLRGPMRSTDGVSRPEAARAA